MSEDLVKIWSFEHDAWWRANSRGYTNNEAEAGLYERSKALEICKNANYGDTLNEEIVEVNKPPLRDRIANLMRDINAQDNRATASPYYFEVQQLEWIGPIDEIYGHWDETREVWEFEGEQYDTEAEFKRAVWEYYWPGSGREERKKAIRKIRKAFDDYGDSITLCGVWRCKGVFLTQTAALKHIHANQHRYFKTRTYVQHFWRNSEMETVFEALADYCGVAWERK